MPEPVLRAQRLRLRTATAEDAEEIVRYLTVNREHLAPWEPLRTEAHFTAPFWRAQLAHDIDQLAVRLFVFPESRPDRIIGGVSFTQIVRGPGHYCNLGYHLAQSEQGKGYMTEALTSAIAYAFDTLNLHRVKANYMPPNRRSGAVLRRLGFTVEGYARDYLLINGSWEDHILTSLLNPAWKPSQSGAV